jgi:hypothetical protein
LWETFLLQMDDFDRLLEFQLRRRLDAVVAAPVPIRRGRDVAGGPKKDGRDARSAKFSGATVIDLSPDSLVFLEHS